MMTRSNLFAYKISIFVQFGKYVEEFLKKSVVKFIPLRLTKVYVIHSVAMLPICSITFHVFYVHKVVMLKMSD